MYFRSAWEANYARVLNLLKQGGEIKSWEYEPKRFYFDGIRRGTNSYLPDFFIEWANGKVEWHEVKGHMTQKSRTALKRMAKYYPDEVIVLIDSAYYKNLKKRLAGLIEWE